jgi:cyclin H
LNSPSGTHIGPCGVCGSISRCVSPFLRWFCQDVDRIYALRQSLPDASIDKSQAILDAATNHVRIARLTDAELIYTPSQIALACLALANPSSAGQWVSSKSVRGANELEGAIEAIKELITRTGHVPDVESVREVDRRLKLCKNPEKVVGSKAYLAKKAEEARKAEEKRSKKAMEVQQTMEAGDPFGDELAVQTVDDDDD